MSNRTTEDIISALYDMVQDARSMPLNADKCIVERDRVLDMLDEIIAELPGELKQSRTIVESRNELINQARREAESILRQAQDQAKQMITKEAIYAEAKRRSEELVGQTQTKIAQLRQAGNEYMDDALRRTEETIAAALDEVKETRMKFRTVTEAHEQRKALYGLSDEDLTATLIAREVSDGVIAPGYTEEALAILKAKRKGGYNVVAIDPNYVPAEQENKQIFGITFQQGRNNFKIGEHLLENIVTANKELPESAKIDLIVSLITLKYTQSNSVCFAYDGQAIGVGAGQQSRVHCVRLAGGKADTWFLRQHPKTLNLPFRSDLGRAGRDNVIDGYINGNEEDVCAEGIWQNYFTVRPEPLTAEEKRAWLDSRDAVALGSDAFFPFADSVKRGVASGVKYIAQPGGSIRDDLVIEECDKHGIVMAFTGMRLFHH